MLSTPAAQSHTCAGKLVLRLMLIAGLLLSCSPKLEVPPASVRLQFSCRQADLAYFAALAERFQLEHNDFSVAVSPWPEILVQGPAYQSDQIDSVRQLAHRFDAFFWPGGAAEYGETGLLEDLTPFISADRGFDQRVYYPSLLEYFRSSSGTWGIPAAIDPFILVYDPEAFADADVRRSSANWTWEDLLAMAAKLARPAQLGEARFGLSDNELDAVVSVVASHSTSHDDALAPLPGLQWYADLVLKHGIMPNPTNSNFTDPVSLIRNGHSAMAVSPTSLWLQMALADKQKLRIAALPVVSSARVYGYFVSAGSTHPHQAYEWISYLAEQAQLRDLLPPRPSLIPIWSQVSMLNQEERDILNQAAQQLASPPIREGRVATLKKAASLILQGEEADGSLAVLQQEQAGAERRPPEPGFVLDEATKTETMEIVFATPYYNPAFFAPLTDAFVRANPDLRIKIVNASDLGYTNGSPAAMLAQGRVDCFLGTAPRVGNKNAYRDQVLHLQPLIEADRSFARDDYVPYALAALTFEDGLWGIPAGLKPAVLWYNRSLFDQAQVPYPTAFSSWDALLATAARVARQDSEGQKFGFWLQTFLSGVPLLEELVGAESIDLTSAPPQAHFNTQAAQSAVRRLQTLVNDGVVPRREAGADTFLLPDLVQGNRLAMWRGGALDSLPQPDSPLQPVLLPNGLQSKNCYGNVDSPVYAYYISARTNNVQSSWRWLRFLTDQVPLAIYIPPRRSLIASQTFRNLVGAEAQTVYQAAVDCSPTNSTFAGQDWPHAWRARIWLAQAIDAVLWQGANIDVELAAAQEKADKYLSCLAMCPDQKDAGCAQTCMVTVDPQTDKLFTY